MTDDSRNRRSGVSSTGTQTPSSGGDRPGPRPTSRLIAVGAGIVAMVPAILILSLLAGGIPMFVGALPGGAVAGYLRGSSLKDGVLTGALAGGIVAIPGMLFAGLLLYLSGSVLIGGATGDGGFALVAALFVLVIVGLTIVLSAIGGAIGSVLTNRASPGTDRNG